MNPQNAQGNSPHEHHTMLYDINLNECEIQSYQGENSKQTRMTQY